MTEAASQPIPAKPALSLITRSGLLLAATPSILWLLLYFALAAHLRLGLGRWPDSIGDNPDTPLFQMHTELVWMYFTALLFSLFAVPLIIAVLESEAFTPDESRVITVFEDGSARVWDQSKAPAGSVLEGHTGLIYAVAISPDGAQAITCSVDKSLRICDLTRGSQTRAIENLTAGVWSVCYSRD